MVSANIVGCKKRTRANFTYQPFSAQVTKMQISIGDMSDWQFTGLVTIQSQDLQIKVLVVGRYSRNTISFSYAGINGTDMSSKN